MFPYRGAFQRAFEKKNHYKLAFIFPTWRWLRKVASCTAHNTSENLHSRHAQNKHKTSSEWTETDLVRGKRASSFLCACVPTDVKCYKYLEDPLKGPLKENATFLQIKWFSWDQQSLISNVFLGECRCQWLPHSSAHSMHRKLHRKHPQRKHGLNTIQYCEESLSRNDGSGCTPLSP